ncbi:MAG: polyprenyl synthetase family protein [Christensenellales bacterium]
MSRWWRRPIEQVLPQTEDGLPERNAHPQAPVQRRCAKPAGGRQTRARVLLLATCEMLGGDIRQARVPAAALEMIHTYSLIHDDLPRNG